MATAITWFMAFFSSVILLLKHLFRLTKTYTEKDTIAVVAAVEEAMAATAKAATIASEFASVAIATALATEQSKAAIAAAEAAIGDAEATAKTAFVAVSAAQAAAAAAAVGLTNHGGDSAALKNQSVFRGYSARKHLRALKRLMKMLAYVRGYLVSEQATTSLYSMQTPIKARAIVRSQTKRRLIFDNMNVDSREDHIIPSHSRRLSASLETCVNIVDESPKIVKVDPTYMAHTQSFKAKLKSYRAPKQRPELKAGSKSSFRANLKRVP